MKQNNSIHEEIKKEIQYFSSEIDRLNFLSKELQATEDFDALEKLWLNEKKEYGATTPFWRGADIQVVPCQNGETEEDWRALETLQVGHRIDEPCPSRFPEMLSGLLVRLSETPPFIGRAQRYEYYFNIHKICMQLELNGSSATKAQICGRIIFEQIRLLNSWIHELTVELQTPPPPNLLEQGWKYYFAYGRNVNRTAMLGQDRCPSALGGIQASLENYRFAIDQRNVATVIRAEGMSASGILWLINPDDELQLDAREGVNSTPPYYRKETVTVKITHAGAYNSPEEVEALIYVSNFPEGDTPREGYVEEIIEGLSEAYYSEEIIASYRKYLPTKIENVNAVAGNTEPVTDLQPVDIKLTSEFRDIIKQEAVPVFSNANREDAKSGCIKIFEALNFCFSRHSSDLGDSKALTTFLIDFLSLNDLENLCKSSCLKELSQLNPLITADKILLENNVYPGSESNDREKEIIESANSDHRQFKSEYKKASEKLTAGKMKRLIRKLSMLLWTIRSNMVHGSKIAMDDEEYQNRTEVISELTIRVLFEVINSLLAGGLKNFAVYGELRRGHPLFNEYMRKSEFRGLGYITGLEWRDSNDTKWIEVGAAQNQISSELYSVNELNFFKPLDLLEKAAERKLTEFNSDSNSVFAWVYSKPVTPIKPRALVATPLQASRDFRLDENAPFRKSDAIALMYCVGQLEQKFKLVNASDYQASAGMSFEIGGLKFEDIVGDKVVPILDQTGTYVGLKLRYAAELKKNYDTLKRIVSTELFPNTPLWKIIESELLLTHFKHAVDYEVDFMKEKWPDLFSKLAEKDLEEICEHMVLWFYNSIFAIANRLSENYHESFPDVDWGREAEQVFDILSDHKDFEF